MLTIYFANVWDVYICLFPMKEESNKNLEQGFTTWTLMLIFVIRTFD